MKNKKASLLAPEFIIKVVLAVIAILILFYMLNNFYAIFQGKQHLEIAKGHIDNIIYIMDNELEEGEVREYIIMNPKDWFFFSFLDKKPICFCYPGEILIPVSGAKHERWIWEKVNRDYLEERCEERGICKEAKEKINFDIRRFDFGENRVYVTWALKIYNPPIRFYISKERGEFYIRDYDTKEFNSLLQDILDLRGENIEQEIKNLIEQFEKERERKIAVVLEYKDTGKSRLKIIPEKARKLIGEENFLVSRDKDENTAVYLIVKKK